MKRNWEQGRRQMWRNSGDESQYGSFFVTLSIRLFGCAKSVVRGGERGGRLLIFLSRPSLTLTHLLYPIPGRDSILIRIFCY